VGPLNYAVHETYKLGLDREPPKSNLSKGSWGGLLPPTPGECAGHVGGGNHSRARVGAVSGGAA
jgi:hypothetical protein